jgi:hypothetical protein
MTTGMFILQPNGSLIPMNKRTYDSEEKLQIWIADHPELLAGEQIQPDSPRRWLLIKREAGIPDQETSGSRWSLDHLFVDQDGIPTFVEVKRSSDTRIRREVVGQMLDYAANAIKYWPAEHIKEMFLQRCRMEKVEPEEEIHLHLGADITDDELWPKVTKNLEDGYIRLLFVSDEIPRELQSIVEFLNKQMDRTQVFAIEIHQYTESSGSGIVTLVPRLLGQSIESQLKKKSISPIGNPWDEESFFNAVNNELSAEEVLVIQKVYDWSKEKLSRIAFGRGQRTGSFGGVLDAPSGSAWPILLYTYGSIEFVFQYMPNQPVFNQLDKRREFLERLLEIDRFNPPLNEETLSRRPSIKASDLVDSKELDKLFSALNWFVEQVKAN